MKLKNYVMRGVALLLLPAMFYLSACNQSTVADELNILGTAASTVATLEGNSQLAAQLNTDVAAASKAVLNWKSGTPAQNVVQALDIVRDDLALFPVTSQYAALINLAIGTTEQIIQAVNHPSATAAQARVAPHVALPTAKDKSDFRKQWNAIVAANPSLAAAKLK